VSDDRREFPRLQAAVFCRPAGKTLFGRRAAQDISMGGIRLYADDPHTVGDRLELELFLPDHGEVTCRVEVVWIETLPVGAPARFDVGVKLVAISDADRARLAAVLEKE
jgi:Tfp pilus assembly protein PilZ